MSIIGWEHPETGLHYALDEVEALGGVIPAGVLAAIAAGDEGDTRHKGVAVTHTAGLTCPRKTLIPRVLDVHVDPTKMWAMMRGTMLHEQLGFAQGALEGWWTEELHAEACVFEGTLFGVHMSCKVDALRQDYGELWDYKFRKPLAAKFMDVGGAASLEDACQVNIARMLIEQARGVDLAGMRMVVWVDAGGWKRTMARVMEEGEVGAVKPYGGLWTVKELFTMTRDALVAWGERGVGAVEAVRTLPLVGQEMFKQRSGLNMCTSYCPFKGACDEVEGGL